MEEAEERLSGLKHPPFKGEDLSLYPDHPDKFCGGTVLVTHEVKAGESQGKLAS